LASETEGFRNEFFGALADVEAGSFWFRARNELIVWAVRSYFPESRSFLEIGCGTGFVLSGLRSAFPAMSLSGSEVLTAGLEFAAKRVPGAELYQMDARQIPFRDAFDGVGAFDVLEHIEADETVLAEMAAALHPGGGLFLSLPQHPRLWSPQDDHALHVRRYTARGLRRKVEAAGFEIIRMTSFVSLLLPMLVAARLRARQRGPERASEGIDELRLPKTLNRALEAIMTIERGAIRRGLSFPVGGSLLVVARRVDGR
jgi:SAM-dependent methyltransferase